MTISFGLQKFLDDIRYNRDRYRQFVGITYVILVSIAGKPNTMLFFTGTILVIIGISIRMWASGHIKKNKVLATDGPYAYVRHPLYVGNLTLGFGFALASSLWWSIPLFLGIIFIFYPHAVHHEDEKLHNMFKEDWEEWRKKTRALIPRFTPYRPGQRGNWSFMQSLKQNGEPVIALFLLFWLFILSMGLY